MSLTDAVSRASNSVIKSSSAIVATHVSDPAQIRLAFDEICDQLHRLASNTLIYTSNIGGNESSPCTQWRMLALAEPFRLSFGSGSGEWMELEVEREGIVMAASPGRTIFAGYLSLDPNDLRNLRFKKTFSLVQMKELEDELLHWLEKHAPTAYQKLLSMCAAAIQDSGLEARPNS